MTVIPGGVVHEIGPWGWYQILVLGVGLPWLAFQSRKKLHLIDQVPLRRHFASVLVVQGITVALSLGVARLERIPLFPATLPTPLAAVAALGLLAGAVLLFRPQWRAAVARGDPTARLFMPRTAGDRQWWVAVSAAAGICEEISYRGVLTILLTRVTGSPLAGVLVSAAAFGLGHAVQGWTGIFAAAGVALAMQGLVAYSGSLYLAMAVHVAYDVIAGFTYARLGDELGYPR